MIKKTLLTLALLLTGLFSAKASFLPANGDLFLGFETSAGVGASTNYVVDLGSAANLASVNLNIATDLVKVYGASWYTRTDLYYGLIGAVQPAANGDPINTLYASVTSGGTPLTRDSMKGQGVVAGNVFSMAGQINSDSTINSQIGTVTKSVFMATSEPSSWSAYSTYLGSAFASFSSGGIETGIGNALDIYRLPYATGAALGTDGTLFDTLSVSSNGLLIVSAVPEPSSYALFGLGAVALVIVARRRKVAYSS